MASPHRLIAFGWWTNLLVSAVVLAAAPRVAADQSAADVVKLAPYKVTVERIEDFGLRVTEVALTFVAFVPLPEAPYVQAVLPNTAASRAGLQPGDRILKSDGRSASMTIFSEGKWRKFLAAKHAAAAAGQPVEWILEIQPNGTTATRTVTLTLPTPPPRWGAAIWSAPEGRAAVRVAEPGPLAELSRGLLANGVWTMLDRQFLSAPDRPRPVGSAPGGYLMPSGYQWQIGDERSGWHQITVTQVSGRTEVVLETSSRLTGHWVYRTSPSGALERAWHFTRRRKGEVSLDEARVGFDSELELWTAHVGRFSPRWPYELQPGYDADAIFAVLAAPDGAAEAAPPGRAWAPDFLTLPPATAAQRALLADAWGRIGADADGWAYTETSQASGDKRVFRIRVDPSKPAGEQCVLLSINGKAPKPADVQRWRDDGGDLPKALGDLPPLGNLLDLNEVRIHAEDTASVVFEVPIRSANGDFPAEQFRALLRVNRASRAFEDITVALRDAIRVAGIVKVTDAGLAVQFQTLDPALSPQPVRIWMGGGARVLWVKLARASEIVRSDFVRVAPTAAVEADDL